MTYEIICHYVCIPTLDSAYNEKKIVEILFHYRQLFIKGDVFIGEWGIFGAEVFLCYSRFFVKGDFIIGRVECIRISLLTNMCLHSCTTGGSRLSRTAVKPDSHLARIFLPNFFV